MRNTLKKVMGAVLIVALLMGVLTVPPQNAQAASKNYMKGLKLNWDLKKNKTVKFKIAMNVIKGINIQGKVTNYKIVNAKKAGYKKLTFTVTCKDSFKKPSNEQIHEMARVGIQSGESWFSVVDYNTGLSLEKKNKFNVTVKSAGWKVIKEKIYEDAHGCYIGTITQRAKVSITYPEDYDGLCIGVGGQNQLKNSKADKSFWKGKEKFGKTSYYKTGKKNSHWMRVRASKKKQPTGTSKPQTTATPAPTGNTPATPVPTASPDGTGTTEVPTIYYDGRLTTESWKAIWDLEGKGKSYKVIMKDGITTNLPCDGFAHMISITLPDSLTEIGDEAFLGCSSLTDIKIPDGVTSIGESAFRGCKSLKSITIPEGVTSIGKMAFASGSLESITIPDSVTSIKTLIFGYSSTTKLTSITWKGTTYSSADEFYQKLGIPVE